MHDTRPHPLLAQVPLVVSPSVNLPAAPTLPYTYKQMPSSLPPSETGITGSRIQHHPPPPPTTTTTTNTMIDTTNPLDHPSPSPASTTPPVPLPQYVVSASGTSAHPSEISTQCAALLAHIARLQTDAQRDLDAFEERRHQADLAERRRVAPGWLDSESRLLEPERDMQEEVEKRRGGGGGGGGEEGSKVQGLGRDMFASSTTPGGGVGGVVGGRQRSEEDEERELQNAVAVMNLGDQKRERGHNLGDEMDRAFGGL